MKRPVFPPTLRDEILRRDGECMAAKLGFAHQCRTTAGTPHPSTALHFLTMEHVHDGYGMTGKRAPDDAGHVVALCGAMNGRPPSKEMRAAFRAYLAGVNYETLR